MWSHHRALSWFVTWLLPKAEAGACSTRMLIRDGGQIGSQFWEISEGTKPQDLLEQLGKIKMRSLGWDWKTWLRSRTMGGLQLERKRGGWLFPGGKGRSSVLIQCLNISLCVSTQSVWAMSTEVRTMTASFSNASGGPYSGRVYGLKYNWEKNH